MRGWPSAQEPQNNLSVLQLEEHADTKKGKVIVDYELDVDYVPKWAYHCDESDAHEEEEVEKSDAEYAKMELPWLDLKLCSTRTWANGPMAPGYVLVALI